MLFLDISATTTTTSTSLFQILLSAKENIDYNFRTFWMSKGVRKTNLSIVLRKFVKIN